jgi:tetratricopeptide (TPR) repeat protein
MSLALDLQRPWWLTIFVVETPSEASGNERDPLLSTDPSEDQGALTASWYGFQHNCALRLLLAAVANRQKLTMVFETHEDILMIDAGGRVTEAIGVKHRDNAAPWSRAELLGTKGPIAHLFKTWRTANRAIDVRCMSNAALGDGRSGAEHISAAAASPSYSHRREVIEAFAQALDCGDDEAESFLDRLHLDTGLPSRHHIAAAQTTQLLLPALKILDLPLSNPRGTYTAALHFVADHSKDSDPLDTDTKLALLRRDEHQRAVRAARITSRTVTSDGLILRLKEAALETVTVRHREVHPVALPQAFVDRPIVRAEIRDRLDSPDTHIVAVEAVGGEGKSTLVKKFVEDAPDSSAILSFSFKVGTPEQFLDEACALIAPEAAQEAESPFEQARLLARALLDANALLVLHEFEEILISTRGPSFGHFASAEIRELITLLLSAERSRSRVLLTTRIVPVEISELARYDSYHLPPLDEKESLIYLRRRGIVGSDEDLGAAASQFFGHPLTLAALADFLFRSRWQGNIAGAETFEGLPKSRDGRLAAVLASYAELLSNAELDIVLTIAASHGVLDRDTLVTVCEAIGMGDEELDTAFATLADSVLLSRDTNSSADELVTHGLISQHFLSTTPSGRIRQIRKALIECHLAHMPTGRAESVHDAQPGIAAFQQYVTLRQWKLAYELYDNRLPVPQQLFWSGHYRVCSSLTEPLLGAWQGGEVELDSEEIADLLLDRGRVEAKVATVDSALKAFDQATELAPPGSSAHSRGLLYGVEVGLEGGRCLLAHNRLGDALRRGLLDPNGFRVSGRRGYVHGCLGNRRAAMKLLSAAISEAAAADSSGDYTATGYLCLFLRIRADLAIRFGDIPQAHADIDRALEIATGPRTFRDYEGHLHRARGDAYLATSGPDGAHSHYTQAERIAADSGYRWLRAETLIGLSQCAIRNGDKDEALRLADDALGIACDGGWWVEQGNAHVLRGEIGLVGGAFNPADDIAAALALARKSGHHLLASQAEQVFQEWTEGRS